MLKLFHACKHKFWLVTCEFILNRFIRDRGYEVFQVLINQLIVERLKICVATLDSFHFDNLWIIDQLGRCWGTQRLSVWLDLVVASTSWKSTINWSLGLKFTLPFFLPFGFDDFYFLNLKSDIFLVVLIVYLKQIKITYSGYAFLCKRMLRQG